MNIVVLDQYVQNRPLPDYALRPVPIEARSAVETLVARIGREVHNCSSSITIVGLPWVNPAGRGRRIASLSDYLNDPVQMRRALEVALTSRTKLTADAAVVAVDISFQKQLTDTRDWVVNRLSSAVPRDHIVWHVFDPGLGAVLTGLAGAQNTAPVQQLAKVIDLPSSNATLKSFSDAVHPLFN